ncbi:hypothetical protein [Sphingomicrobium sediminis]|uniref:Uncharacterized protein n=1 Tax=Sphingomicrobium sediminis TaxID=2950949 RepID=A0A9X2EGZ0_9SPHN|nr:hypothetical protein [Sphingomicrobium sediminis]MCM8557241.1 hypothetical protein [Sphingomicrobium sediminis]
MPNAFVGSVIHWGDAALLCDGKVKISGDGEELAAAGDFPEGPIWIAAYQHDPDHLLLRIGSHEPPDEFGFVHDLKSMFAIGLPRQIGGFRGLSAGSGMLNENRLDLDVRKGRADEIHLTTTHLHPGNLNAWGQQFRCSTERVAGGTRFRLDAMLHPRKGSPKPLDEEIRLEVDIVIPPPHGHHKQRYDGEESIEDRDAIDWRQMRFANVVPGHVRWGQNRTDDGPFVTVNQYSDSVMREPRLLLRPARAVVRSSSGHYRGSTQSDGPELLLPIGWDRILELLYERPQARLALEGDGIGYLDGQSGRSVFECGGHMRQPIERIAIDLNWDGEWLSLKADGKIMRQHRNFGPDVDVAIYFHAHWLAAHRRLPSAKPEGAAT